MKEKISNMEIQLIDETVRRFRSGLEQCHDQFGVSFSAFPEGCCGDVTELLAAFLKDSGHGNFAYISGWREGENATSHAWLEQGDILIDATIDQFPEAVDQRMVSTDPAWHAQFSENRVRREDGDFRVAGSPHHLLQAYEILKKHLVARQ